MFCHYTFPAHNLNFPWRWRWWDWIQAILLNLFYFTKVDQLPILKVNNLFVRCRCCFNSKLFCQTPRKRKTNFENFATAVEVNRAEATKNGHNSSKYLASMLQWWFWWWCHLPGEVASHQWFLDCPFIGQWAKIKQTETTWTDVITP